MRRRFPLLPSVALLLAALTSSNAAMQHANSPSPAMPTGVGPRVLVKYDMEGLAGQDDWRMASAWWPEKYTIGQRLLAEDVNAVVAGLFDGGASVVDVFDDHGADQPGFNLPPERLDRRVRYFFHRHDDAEMEKNTYDAVALVAAHGKTGSGGFMAHTQTFGISLIINGRSASEAEWDAYEWGEKEVPVIFVSGDDRLRDDLLSVMPWLQYVVTKRSLSPQAVELRPLDVVRREMREGAATAVRELAKAKPLRVSTPVHAALRAVPPADLSALRDVPGVNYVDGEVRFDAPNLEAAGRGLSALREIAVEMGEGPIMDEILKSMPNWSEIHHSMEAGFWQRWIELETERAKKTAAPLQQNPSAASVKHDSFGVAIPSAEAPIAFESNRNGRFDVYAINPDGSHLQQLTHAAVDESNGRPVWSPDCSAMAFVKLLGEAPVHSSQIYAMAADGTNVRPLGRAPTAASDWEPAWSPDGKQLAFVSDRDGNPDIYVMRADGSDVRRLTSTPGRAKQSLHPSWPPRGDVIAFDSNRNGTEEIYEVAVGSGQVRQLTHVSGPGREDWTPAFSVDGKKIVFTSNREAKDENVNEPSGWGIYVMDADGAHIRRMWQGSGDMPRWSPDGSTIIFQAKRPGNVTLYLVDAEGTYLRTFSPAVGISRHADWCRTPVQPHPSSAP